MLQDGDLVTVRPAVFARAADAADLTAEDRAIVRAHALALVSAQRPVFSHTTAAALHGLPLYGVADPRPHTTVPPSRPRTAVGVVRHRGDLVEGELVEVDGMRCTGLARTVADVARTAPYETAVCVADGALRQVAARWPDDYDEHAAQAFVTEAKTIARRSAHGVWRALRVLAFADGRAQLPGESISRIRLAELGFARPRLQARVAGPTPGVWYFLDFALDDVDAFGEFDGKRKYVDPAMAGGRTPAEILDAEKRREDWIRGTTQRRFARWGWNDLRTAAALADRLAAFHIRPPRR